MSNSSEHDEFSPKSFEALDFYDERLLFTWNGNRTRISWLEKEDELRSRILLAPRDIRKIQSFSGRVFVTCKPYGVYKLSKAYQFALLSPTAIGIGAQFYQVLTLKDEYIYFGDKQNKVSKLLIKFDQKKSDVIPCVVGMVSEEIDDQLLGALREESDMAHNEFCVLTNGYEIFKITSNGVKILYSSPYPIIDIEKVKKRKKVACLLFVTNTSDAILMYPRNGDLIFEKFEVDQKLETVCACCDEKSDKVVWLIHSDGKRTYRSRKVFGEYSIDSVELKEKNILCIRHYDSKILGLDSSGEIIGIDPKIAENSDDSGDEDFVKLKPEMLKGTKEIVEAICDKVKELQSYNEKLLSEQNALKRINLVAIKQKIPIKSRMGWRKIGNHNFVNFDLSASVAENCQLSVSLKSGGRKIFSTKRVTGNRTNIELPIPDFIILENSTIDTDLITSANESFCWCFVKNCIKNNEDDESDVRTDKLNCDKTNLTMAGLTALRNLNSEETVDIEKLDAIMNGVRKAVNGV
ncbi:uncharacterized protein LOC105683096 [Athalia rosae]|uniref:uncharacterized protein LOC105683096 n=1 Tax=Athalia rosae TaxID=37344 RepID=UPI00203471CF|nr:uncharacterized protein LOC105683096 [Athalia rosae]